MVIQTFVYMKLEENAKADLIKREMHIRRLIRQMELDKLSRSTVYRNLEVELRQIKGQLMLDQASR
jgi:hypothetical protein